MDTRFGRRQALRLLGGAALATMPALKLVDEASAGRAWCRYDPIFNIGGYLFDITVGADEAMLTEAKGPVELKLRIPFGMTAKLVYDDEGFGYGYSYQVIPELRAENEKGFQVGVEALFPARANKIPVSLMLASVDKKGLSVDTKEIFGTSNRIVRWRGFIAKVAPDNAYDLVSGGGSST